MIEIIDQTGFKFGSFTIESKTKSENVEENHRVYDALSTYQRNLESVQDMLHKRAGADSESASEKVTDKTVTMSSAHGLEHPRKKKKVVQQTAINDWAVGEEDGSAVLTVVPCEGEDSAIQTKKQTKYKDAAESSASNKHTHGIGTLCKERIVTDCKAEVFLAGYAGKLFESTQTRETKRVSYSVASACSVTTAGTSSFDTALVAGTGVAAASLELPSKRKMRAPLLAASCCPAIEMDSLAITALSASSSAADGTEGKIQSQCRPAARATDTLTHTARGNKIRSAIHYSACTGKNQRAKKAAKKTVFNLAAKWRLWWFPVKGSPMKSKFRSTVAHRRRSQT